MELAGAALRRSLPTLPSACPAAAGAAGRRRRPARVACSRGAFAEEGHLRYYEAAAPRKAVEAVARDLAKLRAMGLVAGDAAKEKVLSEATDLLLQELDQLKEDEYKMKKMRKEEKAYMKALEKEAKKATAAMNCEDDSSSESSESECEEEEPAVKIGQGMAGASTAVPETVASDLSTAFMMKQEKAVMKAMKKMEKEWKKAAKRAMKMEKEAKKMAMAVLNGCDEDSSCSSESSDSECEGEVVRMSRCATIVAPETPEPPSTIFPIIVPQLPAPMTPEPSQDAQISPEPVNTTQGTSISSIAALEAPMASRIEVCMGGKCKKSGAVAVLQAFEEEVVGTGAVVAGCKCLGKCGLGPNVRLRTEGSAKRNPLCIGVGLEDVGTIVAGLFGDSSDLGMTPA